MTSTLEVLFVLDPLKSLNPLADSSYVMVREAVRRGHTPFGVELAGLSVTGAGATARAVPLAVGADEGPITAAAPPESRPVQSFPVVLMRKDPPLDSAYLAATWILERCGDRTLVINDPQGLRDLNEKLAILAFPELIPRTCVTRDADELRTFLADVGGTMIVKPVYGFGGREVLLARDGDPNLSTILELATKEGTEWTVAQEFIADADKGDKRILLVDGEPVGAVLRVAATGELRSNFHAGGLPHLTELDDNDRAICSRVGPVLRERGQFFAGIDVIGGLLTEINVTSPTGMQEVNRLGGLSGESTMEALFWAALESTLGARR